MPRTKRAPKALLAEHSGVDETRHSTSRSEEASVEVRFHQLSAMEGPSYFLATQNAPRLARLSSSFVDGLFELAG